MARASICSARIRSRTLRGAALGVLESLIAAAREPKKLVWYEAGRGLNQASYDDRVGWLEKTLAGA
ncbi:MAG: hypothetical protein ABSB75_06080 [Candidatus Limnocylindrales bacterium]